MSIKGNKIRPAGLIYNVFKLITVFQITNIINIFERSVKLTGKLH